MHFKIRIIFCIRKGIKMIEISGYEIKELIYNGKKSLVYRGVRIADGKLVILKVLNANSSDASDLERFREEFSTAKSFFDSLELVEIENSLCIVMDDIGGLSLDQINYKKSMKPQQFLKLAISIVEKIDDIHKNHVIHKDINPSNIVWNQQIDKVEVIDFGISTKQKRENPETSDLDLLVGTLAYMSPEQTGRINKSVDYRTDYYSLGVTLYEILTGKHPFEVKDAMGIVHSHIAIAPKIPTIENNELWTSACEKQVFDVVANIIVKLMSKSADNRYQSSYGLNHDLNTCLMHLNSECDELDLIEVGKKDISELFRIPQKLYGREKEIAVLNHSLKHVCSGAKEFVLVAGYSGVGKSSLVYEIQKSTVDNHGYFIEGKFDQFKRDVPYSAFGAAVSKLVKFILHESEESIVYWREKLRNELGENGQIAVDLVPELELIIGKQTELPKIGLDETRNRFNNTVQIFIRALGTPSHPVVIFLDDLHWADVASLKLIELIMSDREIKGLLLVGAYRDNEIDLMHPLSDSLEKIMNETARVKDAGIVLEASNITKISLEPLEPNYILKMLCDTLLRTPEELKEVSKLCYEKTEGNPFFFSQLLQSLYEASIFNFNRELGIWEWNHEKLSSFTISDNVIDLMLKKIKALSVTSQNILKLAACAGNTFDLDVLSTIYENTLEDTLEALQASMNEGLIKAEDESFGHYYNELESKQPHKYSFIHDRIQQAAYMLIEEDKREKAHLSIARLMLERALLHQEGYNLELSFEVIKKQEMVFEIVNHFNQGIKKLEDKSEIEMVLRLNHQAGLIALKSNAYKPALNYFEIALALIEENNWSTHYEITMNIHLNAVEAYYYNFEFEQMRRLSESALKNARSPLDEAPIYEVLMKALYTEEKLDEVLDVGFKILKRFNVSMVEKPKTFHVLINFLKTKLILKNKSIEELYNQKLMEDEKILAICRIMAVMVSSAYVVRANLSHILSLKLVQFSVKYGNYPNAQIYPFYGLMNLLVLNDMTTCFNFGDLGVKLSKRNEFSEARAQNILMFSAFAYHWKKPLRDSIPLFKEGYRAAMDNGDFEYASWCMHCPDYTEFYSGMNLKKLLDTMDSHREKMIELNQNTILSIYTVVQQSVANIVGNTENPTILTGKYMNEEEVYNRSNDGSINTTIASLYFWKFYLDYMFHNFKSAIDNSKMFEKYSEAHAGLASIPVSYFITSLSYLGYYDEASEKDKPHLINKVRKLQKKMKKIASNCPENNLHKWHLVEAESSKVKDNRSDAVMHYERAISLAKKNRFLNDEALSYELYAIYNLDKGQTEIGYHLMRKSHKAYRKWGAQSKVKQIENQYPELFTEPVDHLKVTNTLTQTNTQSGRISSSILDVSTSLNVFQILSGEVRLEHLLKKVMELVIQNAGAEKGWLILPNDNEWSIEAIRSSDGCIEVMKKIPILNVSEEAKITEYRNDIVPMSIIKYVLRTKDAVVLDNATEDGEFTNDQFIKVNSPKSIICMPLLNQSKLNGILYLENNLTTGAFSSNQVEILNMLSSQAAISLENAKLYQNLEYKIDKRTKELKDLSSKYQELSITDQLTKIYNRRKIDQVLNVEFNNIKNNKSYLSIILFDIDKFKNVNDIYGHLTGDKVLVQLADQVQNSTKESDLFGRWGGEEFILICPNTTSEKAVILANRLRLLIANSTFEEVQNITCSFGVATTDGSKSIDACLNDVDVALYKAKENGRNCVEVH